MAVKSGRPPRKSVNAWRHIFAVENRLALVNAAILLLGYITWYFSRAHISALSSYLKSQNILPVESYALMTSIGYGIQLLFKSGSGFVMDYFGTAKFIFLANGLLCVLFTLINSVWSSPLGFVISGSAIKAATAFARIACVKVLATWYPKEIFGTVGSFIQICSCIGELVARNSLCTMAKYITWQSVWRIGALVTTAGMVPVALFVQGNPPAAGTKLCLMTVMRSSLRSFVPDSSSSGKKVLVTVRQPVMEDGRVFNFRRDVFMRLMFSPTFWTISALSFTTNCITETMVSFGPLFFKSALGVNDATAGQYSSMSTVPAMVGIFVGGQLQDYLRPKQKPWIPVVLLVLACFTFAGIFIFLIYGVGDLPAGETVSVDKLVCVLVLLVVAWFSMAAPSSFLDGAYVVQLAGARGAAFAAGVVSGFGYAGAAITSQGIKFLVETRDGWIKIFGFFIVCAFISLLLSIGYAVLMVRQAQQEEDDEDAAAAAAAAGETMVRIGDATTGPLVKAPAVIECKEIPARPDLEKGTPPAYQV